MLFTLCLLTRFILFLLAYKGSRQTKQLVALVSIVIAIGFLSIYFFGLRPDGTDGVEAIIWWNHLRPLHGLLFALYALTWQNECSAFFLLADVLVGLGAFLTYYK